MKLNLDISLFKPKHPPLLTTVQYKSPINWWTVTTNASGSTRNLGTHYGHVAEIAFELASQCCDSLRFTPTFVESIPTIKKTYQATSHKVWISLDTQSQTWNLTEYERIRFFQQWLDISEPYIKISKNDEDGNYRFASVLLVLI